MNLRLSELRCREVINVKDGGRIGFVCDLELNCKDGDVIALIVPGKPKFLGCFWREFDYWIPWKCIRRIGEDLILIDIDIDDCRKPCKRKKFF